MTLKWIAEQLHMATWTDVAIAFIMHEVSIPGRTPFLPHHHFMNWRKFILAVAILSAGKLCVFPQGIAMFKGKDSQIILVIKQPIRPGVESTNGGIANLDVVVAKDMVVENVGEVTKVTLLDTTYCKTGDLSNTVSQSTAHVGRIPLELPGNVEILIDGQKVRASKLKEFTEQRWGRLIQLDRK